MSSLFSLLLPPISRRVLGSSPPIRSPFTICAECRRSLTSSATLNSGHNKWSKIKHGKALEDKKKTMERSHFAKQLTMSSKLYGPNPSLNGQLAHIVAVAKKAGMPKANIDVAIARGQGKSESGAGLEAATLEVMMPPSIALIIEIETDNKKRALGNLRHTIKNCGGTVTPTAFLFAKQGRTVLRYEADKCPDFDDVMMKALDAGAEDVEREDGGAADEEGGAGGGGGGGNIVVWTQPNMTHQVAQELAKTLDLEILSSDIIWSCTPDNLAKVDDTETAANLKKLISAVRKDEDVAAVFTNAERGEISEEEWSGIEEALEE